MSRVVNNKELMELVAKNQICPNCGMMREVDAIAELYASPEFQWVTEGCIDETGLIGYALPDATDVMYIVIEGFYCPECDHYTAVNVRWSTEYGVEL